MQRSPLLLRSLSILAGRTAAKISGWRNTAVKAFPLNSEVKTTRPMKSREQLHRWISVHEVFTEVDIIPVPVSIEKLTYLTEIARTFRDIPFRISHTDLTHVIMQNSTEDEVSAITYSFQPRVRETNMTVAVAG